MNSLGMSTLNDRRTNVPESSRIKSAWASPDVQSLRTGSEEVRFPLKEEKSPRNDQFDGGGSAAGVDGGGEPGVSGSGAPVKSANERFPDSQRSVEVAFVHSMVRSRDQGSSSAPSGFVCTSLAPSIQKLSSMCSRPVESTAICEATWRLRCLGRTPAGSGGVVWNLSGLCNNLASWMAISTTQMVCRREVTSGEAWSLSDAFPYKIVGELLEKSSVASAYTRTAERPAPRRMTAKLDVLAVVRITGTRQ